MARRARGGAAARRAARSERQITQLGQITRRMPPLEILDDEAVEIIEANADIILEEIGLEFREMEDVPADLVGRLTHYFSTYKLARGTPDPVQVGEPYGRAHAEKVVAASLEDYAEAFPAAASG